MALHSLIIQLLSKKAGTDVTTVHGANVLQQKIEKTTGEVISINTVKRLVGLLNYSGQHSSAILSIIAAYLGFSSPKLLEEYVKSKVSDFNVKSHFIDILSLKEGTRIELQWQPDRLVRILLLEGREFLVEESINSKLSKGDILHIDHLAVGFPLHIREVIREGKSMGNYQAAPINGITNLRML